MYCAGHLRVLIVIAATISLGAIPAFARNPASLVGASTPSQSQENSQRNATTTVNVRWANRPGIFRYRLQLAADRGFHDIIFDRVIAGNEYRIDDLPPGVYFWRTAPLTNKLGEFSSAAPIEVKAETQTNKTQNEKGTARPERPPLKESTERKPPASNSVIATGGWRTAIGEVTHPVLAHLRSPERFGVVGTNAAGVTFALDAASGVALWSTARTASARTARSGSAQTAPILIKLRSGLDNVVVLSGVNVILIEGTTGREIWRSTLLGIANCGAVLSDKGAAEIFVVDNSLQRMFVLNANDGSVIAQVRLSHRIVGRPVPFEDHGSGRMLFAFDSGHVEVRGRAGALVRTGDAGSPATTSPLFVAGPRGGLILVGTRSGLTALSADDLRALGRVVINEDAPRGTLAAADLNGDGNVEVIMLTDHGRIVAVNAVDGKTLWDTAGGGESQSVAFADVNGDGVLDVLMAGGQTFALALSGRDGSLVWRDSQSLSAVANHAGSLVPRSMFAIPSAAGVLLIGSEPSRAGLRAIEFPRATTKPDRH
jgi:outer membrane protein assembly factor BamB